VVVVVVVHGQQHDEVKVMCEHVFEPRDGGVAAELPENRFSQCNNSVFLPFVHHCLRGAAGGAPPLLVSSLIHSPALPHLHLVRPMAHGWPLARCIPGAELCHPPHISE
jgi:hypothetical protein